MPYTMRVMLRCAGASAARASAMAIRGVRFIAVLLLMGVITTLTAAPAPEGSQTRAWAREQERRQAAIAWLDANAVRLKSVETGTGFEDLQPLKGWIGAAHIVALGEATHGTHEFFAMKRRPFEFLVEQMGFTVFAFEASQPELFDIDRYVLRGEGHARGALAGQYFWTWDTQEVLGLIEWMRAYNVDPAHTRKLHFYGFDMQSPVRAAKVAVEYVSRVSPQLGAEARIPLASVLDPFLAAEVQELPLEPGDIKPVVEERKRLAKEAAERLLTDLDLHRAAYIAATGEDAWTLARQHARVLLQSLEMRLQSSLGHVNAFRDRAMADNVDWILQREGPGTRIALWAHNGHLARRRVPDSNTMGSYLSQRHSTDLFSIGFAFNQGGFQSRAMPVATDGELTTFFAAPSAADSLDGTLAAAGLTIAAINLRAVPRHGPAAEWFSEDHDARGYGGLVLANSVNPPVAPNRTPPRPAQNYTPDFDSLVFIETTTAAHNNSVRNNVHYALPAPVNGSFEEGCGAGTALPGWTVDDHLAEFAFEISSVQGGTAGACSLRIRRLPGIRYGEVTRGVSQQIWAEPFRGQRLNLSAQIQEGLAPDGAAYLWLRVTRPAVIDGKNFVGLLRDSPVAYYDFRVVKPAGGSEGWQTYALNTDIPADAALISYGISMVGGGAVQLDNLILSTDAAGAAGK